MIELRLATRESFDDCVALASAHLFNGSPERVRRHVGDLDDATTFALAYDAEEVVGAVTIRWVSEYPPFRAEAIPLIQNIEIRHDLRGHGYGDRVLDATEELIADRRPKAGICVGLFDAYGPAQRLYVRRGYVPDGRGVCRGHEPLREGEVVEVGHDLLLWLVKDLSPVRGWTTQTTGSRDSSSEPDSS